MNDAVFQECLTVSVLLWIDELAESTFEQRAARAQRCSQIVGNHGDAIIYLVPTKGPVKVTKTDAANPGWARQSYSNVGTAAAFNALAEGIACAAYQPGGIKCFGLHFEAKDRGSGGKQFRTHPELESRSGAHPPDPRPTLEP